MNLINFNPADYIRTHGSAPTITLKESGSITFNTAAVRLLWGETIGEVYFQLAANKETGGLYIAPFTSPGHQHTFKAKIKDDHYGGCSVKSLAVELIKRYELAIGNGRKKYVALEIEPKPVTVDNVDWYFIATK